MKKTIFFIFILLLIPLNVKATNDLTINCNKTNLKINEETSCTLNINNLDFTIIDVTGKVKVGDNLSIVSSSYNADKWLSLDTNFNVTDINLMRHNNDKINNITIATFKIKASNNATGDSEISFNNIAVGNSDYQSITLNCNPLNIHFGNNINTLNTLDVSGLNINFSSDKTNYSLEVDNENIKIDAIPTDSKANVSGIGNKKLNYGNNTINIVVTAENGSSKTYTINIKRKDNRSNNNDLSSLSLSKGQLEFDKNITNYTINLPYETEQIEVSYELSDKKGKAEIIGNETLSVGENNLTIKVTAENGDVKEYKITIIRDKKIEVTNSNKISNIQIKGYDISFNKNKFEYTINTSDKQLEIEVTLEDNNSTYEIIGNENLNEGSVISIIVTDKDGNNNIYKLIIKNDNNQLNSNIMLTTLLIISIVTNIILSFILIKKKTNKISNQ